MVDASTVLKGIPDPEVFSKAAVGLGLDPAECVGIEDSQAGINAILAAGMFAVGVGQNLQGAHWQIESTKGLVFDQVLAKVHKTAPII